MDKIDWCIWAINTIGGGDENLTEETIQALKDGFEEVFSDDTYFQKYRPAKYYLQPHYYHQKMLELIREDVFDEEKVLGYMSRVGKWTRRNIIEFVIEYFCDDEHFVKAKEYITKLSETESEYKGYRILLKKYAAKGDLKSFMAILNDCKPKENPKSDIDDCKSLLVTSYALHHGLDQALVLCRDKKIGMRFLLSAVAPIAKQLGYHKTRDLFSEYEILNQAEQYLYEKVLAAVYATDQAIHEEEAVYKEMFELLGNIAPTVKHGDYTLRDWLLLDLALCLQQDDEQKYTKRIAQCRKAIRNNSLKREL